MQEVDRKTLELIRIACRAGAFRRAARVYTEARPTFMAAADLNSAKVRRLALQIARGATAIAPPRAAR